MKIQEYGPYGSEDKEETKWSVEIGWYDKIVEVYIAHTNLGIEGISFGIIDAIGRKITKNVGATLYNFGLKMKSHEFITQISGRIATEPHKTIKSLKIHTNLFPGGYFWSEVKTQSTDEIFSIQLQSRDVIFNIHGTAYLEKKKGVGYDKFILSSFGICVKEVRLSTMKHGPYGFPEIGGGWSIELDRFNYIKEITISHDDIIHGIGFVKVDAFGKISTKQFFGGNNGETYRVVLKHDEFIQKISGKKGFYNSIRKSVIVSLIIYTPIYGEVDINHVDQDTIVRTCSRFQLHFKKVTTPLKVSLEHMIICILLRSDFLQKRLIFWKFFMKTKMRTKQLKTTTLATTNKTRASRLDWALMAGFPIWHGEEDEKSRSGNRQGGREAKQRARL
ncbi:uncharacterized protein LOC110734880 [Chenopodium quinoa]|uniref:uncharacterized protein LOC110734880 n=1 Tax=Chenopodium quinoa TaxID=63459 RepID=UPI000B7786A8|nr:uncharacterized protein LOC110734880 [Chenopodium quinoa]